MIELPAIPLSLLLPEIVLALGGLLILIAVAGGRGGRAPWVMSLLVVALAGVGAFWSGTVAEPVAGGMLAVDSFTRFMRGVLLAAIGAVFVWLRRRHRDADRVQTAAPRGTPPTT